MMKRTPLTQEQLKGILEYELPTGLFRWLKNYHKLKVGKVAGSFSGRYVRIKFGGKSYPAHCLAVLYVKGRWPLDEIDHKDTNKHNNRWNNLREATRQQNAYNAVPTRGKKYTLLKGVTWAKRNKWQASIRTEGRPEWLGYFSTAKEAHAAYAKRAKELRGDFARVA